MRRREASLLYKIIAEARRWKIFPIKRVTAAAATVTVLWVLLAPLERKENFRTVYILRSKGNEMKIEVSVA